MEFFYESINHNKFMIPFKMVRSLSLSLRGGSVRRGAPARSLSPFVYARAFRIGTVYVGIRWK